MHKRKIILLILFTLMLAGAISGIILITRWNKPLGPGLLYPTLTLTTTPVADSLSSTPSSSSSTNVEITSTQPAGPTVIPAPSPTATPQPLCGGPPVMTILAIGSDQSGGYSYGLADSIHVVRIDFIVPNIMVIDFPRDLWVEIPDISDHYGITHGKLNQPYLFGNPGMGYYDGPGGGAGLMARTLDVNFGLRVDHYIAINMETFIQVIDAVGGVDIKLEAPVDLNWSGEPYDPTIAYSAGTHHLDGEHALILARNRVPSTFTRMYYQKIILSALREKLLSPAMMPKLPGLVTRFITSVLTDLSPSDINTLICIGQAVPAENIKADSIPEDMFTANMTFDEYRNVTTFTYSADFDQLRAFIAEFMSGVWPIH